MTLEDKYEAVIGLEVHAQLLTRSKLFCGDSAAFGSAPNTNISPISLAHPGTLPKMNRKAIEFALKLGLSLQCDIVQYNYFARKNYFYPDLPKGYQVSQHTTPICKNGALTIQTPGGERKIALNRIHLEEDAGKSLHDLDEQFTCIDLNRAGVPLLEIVTEPVMYSPVEAAAFLTELRKLVRFLGVCDGNMEEGSLRCDANVSIRLRGETSLGTKVEVKNLNSIRHVKKAIEVEITRLIDLLEKGEKIIQETRSFDAGNNSTFSLRTKEAADDYRYFPEPDLAPFYISDEMISNVKNNIPALPSALIKKYRDQLHLSNYDAEVISDDKDTSDFFERVILSCSNYKAIANWICGPIKSYLNDNNKEIKDLPITGEHLTELINLIDTGQINFSIASSRIFPVMINECEKSPLEIAGELNLLQESNEFAVTSWVDEVLANMPGKVLEYQKGKKGLMALFAGEVKKISKGKADMKLVTDLLNKKLNN